MTTNNNIVIQLLTDNQIAQDAINKYSSWNNIAIPFTTVYKDKMWARTQDVIALVDNEHNFQNARVRYRVLYVEMGSQRLVDTSDRYDVVTDSRLLVTWLHNPTSVALALLTNSVTFNAFIGGQLEDIKPRYRYPELVKMIDEYEQRELLNDLFAA